MLGALLDHHLPPRARRRLFRSWGSAGSMLPVGGKALWGGAGEAAGGAMLYLEERGLDVEAAIAFVMEAAANETLVADQMLNYRSWYSWGLRAEPFAAWPVDAPPAPPRSLMQNIFFFIQ